MSGSFIQTFFQMVAETEAPRWAEVLFKPLPYNRDVLYEKSLTTVTVVNWLALAMAVIACVVLLKLFLRLKREVNQNRILLDINKRELVDTQEATAAAEQKGREELSRAITGLLRRFKSLFMPADADRIFRTALDLARRGVHASSAMVLLVEESSNSLVITHSIGMKEFDRTTLKVSLDDENILSWIVKRGVTIDIDEVMKDDELKNLARESPLEITFCGPIRHGRKIIALLNVGKIEGRTYSSEQKAVFSSILTIISLAYDRFKEQGKKS